MTSSKDVFVSQGLNCSLDIFFLLGILLRSSVVAVLEVVSLMQSFSKDFLQIWKFL